ncbi:MAG: alpha-amylase family glycosyl hydrolase [Proteobacteria bacterium]|nr:alpha-amylase family glycosyl hydrolase [Pseudomonadota bacterium]
MIKELYPWKFGINISIFDKDDLENLVNLIKKGYHDNLFLRYFHNLLIQKGKFKKRQPTFSEIIAYQLINEIYFHIIYNLADIAEPDYLFNALIEKGFSEKVIKRNINLYISNFPPFDLENRQFSKEKFTKRTGDKNYDKALLSQALITRIMNENPACEHFNTFFEDKILLKKRNYKNIIKTYKDRFRKKPVVPSFQKPLLVVLYEPIEKHPDSIISQLEYIKSQWKEVLPPEIYEKIGILKVIIEEENLKKGAGGPGPIEVLKFKKVSEGQTRETYEYPEFEAYTPDTDWMPNVVLIAKMAYVWLYQLSKQYRREIKRLDEIPDEELDRLARWGFNALWLIGIWERSPASQRIKHLCGNIDAASSAYSLYDYTIAEELGGWQALDSLKERAWKRGIRLACDIVPNHMGIVSKWIFEHPDWFLQTDFPPYPNYRFTGENLSNNPDYVIQIEDGYYSRTDAAVVFKFEEVKTGKVRYIYHGNDGTSTPWNDTAQLNYLIPEVRAKMIETIVNIAKHFPIIRFDAAMTLAKKHYQRLWFPLPGHGSGVPSRALFSMKRSEFDRLMPKEFWREVVETINTQVPDTLLIAEAFWLMEGYFVRTLGMHRVYNSAFMNMLKMEENAKYRQTIKNILEFDSRILQRFVNFMNNPDEKTAVEQFGKGDKYFGVAVMLVTMPGLPMFGHGQIEGYHEKYGMEYKRAYYDEQPDQYFISLHEEKIFPLMRRRRLFSGSENFFLFDFIIDGHHVNENVFVYTNMYGNERALVVYNNNLTTTDGTIKYSVKYLKKLEDGSEIYETKSLGDALQLKNDWKYFYICKDYNSHFEYLFNGKDVHEKGISLGIRGYQYYAFLDFREIFDSEGYYAELYKNLNNRPVRSIEEELKFIKYREIHSTFKDLIEKLLSQIISESKEIDLSVANFYTSLSSKGFYDFSSIQKSINALDSFRKLLTDYEFFCNKYEDFKNYNRGVTLILFLFSVFNLVLVSFQSKYYKFVEFIKETNLNIIFYDFLKKSIEEGLIEHYYVNSFDMLKLLFKYREDFKDLNFIEKIFDNEEESLIFGCNTYEGVRWFNKESFEIFFTVMLTISWEELKLNKPENLDFIIKIPELAKDANYKADLFLKKFRELKNNLSSQNLTQNNQ